METVGKAQDADSAKRCFTAKMLYSEVVAGVKGIRLYLRGKTYGRVDVVQELGPQSRGVRVQEAMEREFGTPRVQRS